MITDHDIAIRTGLDEPGSLQRQDDGVQRARRAHPTSRRRRPSDGKTGFGDLPELPGHIPMPTVGDDRTRPGVRSRRRGINSSATLGDAPMSLRDIASAHREASIFVYTQHGRMHPKLWVESESEIVLIEPLSWDKCDVTDWQRAQMICAARRSVDGVVVGRCDEVYIRDLHVPGAMKGGNLADMVDFDPSIRTALMVHSMDCVTAGTYMTMATFDLDNEGMPYWERHETDTYYATFAVPLWASSKIMRRDRHDWLTSQEDAQDVAYEHGWMMTWLQK